MNDKAVIKFNGGKLALLCSGCRVILKEGKDFSHHEKEFAKGDKYLPPQYCDKCLKNNSYLYRQDIPDNSHTKHN